MSTHFDQDRWLLPRQQTEYPARALLSESTLHARREATFLVLTALYFVTTTVLVVLGTTRVIDVSALLARIAPDVTQPLALLVPLGVLPFALSFVASALLCDLLGPRRAGVAIGFGFVTTVGLVGLIQGADLIDGGNAFATAAALAVGSIVAHLFHLMIFDLLRRATPGRHLFARMIIASWLSLALGWAAFSGVLRSGYLVDAIPVASITAMAFGSAIACAAIMLVLAIPMALLARGLSVALRVGPSFFSHDDYAYDDAMHDDDFEEGREPAPAEPAWAAPRPAFAEGSVARRLPQAQIVDDDNPLGEGSVSDGVPRRARAQSIPPYSSAEMKFFADGDEDYRA